MLALLSLLLSGAVLGCGTTREKLATEQLLLSDAVDRAVARIDFSPLAHEKVYLDTRFIQFQNKGLVNTNYVVSSLRQQLVVAGCLLQDSAEESDYVVEARVGTLGSDGHDINYGLPPNNTVNAAATLVSNSVPLPTLPELSLARKTEDMAAAKIAVFAYHRESRRPIWQSGNSVARSQAEAKWILGAGPFQTGSIYNGTQFAGDPLRRPTSKKEKMKAEGALSDRDQDYRTSHIWDERLRNKFESGQHLIPPEFALTDEQPEPSSEPKRLPEVNSEAPTARSSDPGTTQK